MSTAKLLLPSQAQIDETEQIGECWIWVTEGGYSHIPTDLVVAQEASAVESSSRLDFLLLHNLGMSFIAP